MKPLGWFVFVVAPLLVISGGVLFWTFPYSHADVVRVDLKARLAIVGRNDISVHACDIGESWAFREDYLKAESFLYCVTDGRIVMLPDVEPLRVRRVLDGNGAECFGSECDPFSIFGLSDEQPLYAETHPVFDLATCRVLVNGGELAAIPTHGLSRWAALLAPCSFLD